jgi:REP element-mobilizing transposase RayT
MKPDPNERLRRLRRLDFATRSLPAKQALPGAPGSLVHGIHSRGYLPHVKVPGAAYFVTFRLADSLPQEVLVRLLQEAEASARIANREARAQGLPETAEPADFLPERLEAFLDAGHGACWLRRPVIADLVANALRFFDGQRYHLHAWTVMPNHVHAVLRPTPSFTVSSILHSWKSYTAKEANRLLGRAGSEFWQRESFDRWCRDDAELRHWCGYTEGNPVAGRLCDRPEDWKWSSAFVRSG